MVYIKLFVDYLDAIEPLGDAERGRLFTALLEYARTGEAPQLGGNERFIFPMMKAQLDRDAAASAELSEKRSAAASKSKQTKQVQAIATHVCNSTQDKEKEKDKDKEEDKKNKRTRFVPPTIEEVEAYVMERGSSVDPRKFWEYFNAGEWKDAKGNPVRNWKQKLLTWEKYDDKPKQQSGTKSFADIWREMADE